MHFPRSARLLTPGDYRVVFAKARKSSDSCWLVLGHCKAAGHARLGMAISKKNIPRAVARNRLKRLVRETFREHQAELGNLDLVVMARPKANLQSNKVLRESLIKHWKKLSS